MICPNCGFDNLPGSEECSGCLQDLTQLDLPIAQNQVERSLMEDPVHILKPHKAFTVGPETSLRVSIQSLQDQNIGALLVVDEQEKLIGIFTERDLMMRVVGVHQDYDRLPVRDFMTPDPETVTADDTLAFAVHKMDIGGYRHLPVLTAGKPTGIISARDMLRHITRLCKDA